MLLEGVALLHPVISIKLKPVAQAGHLCLKRFKSMQKMLDNIQPFEVDMQIVMQANKSFRSCQVIEVQGFFVLFVSRQQKQALLLQFAKKRGIDAVMRAKFRNRDGLLHNLFFKACQFSEQFSFTFR